VARKTPPANQRHVAEQTLRRRGDGMFVKGDRGCKSGEAQRGHDRRSSALDAKLDATNLKFANAK
jgi:hypothetical protein